MEHRVIDYTYLRTFSSLLLSGFGSEGIYADIWVVENVITYFQISLWRISVVDICNCWLCQPYQFYFMMHACHTQVRGFGGQPCSTTKPMCRDPLKILNLFQ